ncbi:MAG: nucleotide pyrophosphohydrolase [Gammaproteobacteria bacterium]|nr:nucleotide pyrophosphohydrolase [Gammaproteobacteria bacterium]
MTQDLKQLQSKLRQFTAEREWEKFHSPKNLAMALSGEAGELLEHFQWLSEAQSRELSEAKRKEVALEMADVLSYLLRLADELDIDLLAALEEKIRINQDRYPVDKVRGNAKKYTELD